MSEFFNSDCEEEILADDNFYVKHSSGFFQDYNSDFSSLEDTDSNTDDNVDTNDDNDSVSMKKPGFFDISDSEEEGEECERKTVISQKEKVYSAVDLAIKNLQKFMELSDYSSALLFLDELNKKAQKTLPLGIPRSFLDFLQSTFQYIQNNQVEVSKSDPTKAKSYNIFLQRLKKIRSQYEYYIDKYVNEAKISQTSKSTLKPLSTFNFNQNSDFSETISEEVFLPTLANLNNAIQKRTVEKNLALVYLQKMCEYEYGPVKSVTSFTLLVSNKFLASTFYTTENFDIFLFDMTKWMTLIASARGHDFTTAIGFGFNSFQGIAESFFVILSKYAEEIQKFLVGTEVHSDLLVNLLHIYSKLSFFMLLSEQNIGKEIYGYNRSHFIIKILDHFTCKSFAYVQPVLSQLFAYINELLQTDDENFKFVTMCHSLNLSLCQSDLDSARSKLISLQKFNFDEISGDKRNHYYKNLIYYGISSMLSTRFHDCYLALYHICCSGKLKEIIKQLVFLSLSREMYIVFTRLCLVFPCKV